MIDDDRRFLVLGAEPGHRTWRGVGLVALLFGGSLLFAAVTSPLVYLAFQKLAAATDAGPWDYLARHPFPRVFDRLRWLPVLLGLPWLLRHCGLWSFRALGYEAGGVLRRLPLAFAAGVAMMGLLAAFQAVGVGLAVTEAWDSRWPGLLAAGLASGLAVAFLEETVFRGLVQRLFLSSMRPWPGILVGAFVFALLHFKRIPPSVWPAGTPVDAASGFVVAFWTLASVVVTFDLVFFANYFLVGLLLGLVFHRTASLWPCVGLHAGWVAFLAVYRKAVTTEASHPDLIFGTTRLIDGLLPTIVLLALCVAVALRGRATLGR